MADWIAVIKEAQKRDIKFPATSAIMYSMLEELEGLESYRALGTVEELAELVKAKQDNRLVVLPCKVGDMVYYPYAGRILEKKITAFRCMENDWWYEINHDEAETFDEEAIDKTVFLTREEAEAALKEQTNGTP